MSCKKDKKTAEPEPSSIPNSPYAVSTATAYQGVFASNSFTIMSPGNSEAHHNSNAYFYISPEINNMPGNMASVNTVMLNNTSLNYNVSSMSYSAANPSHLLAETWQVQGANSIPSFNYTSKNNTPGCEDFNVAPDTVSKSAGFTISIDNVTNVTGAGIYISDNSNSSAGQVHKLLQNGNNTVTFSPAELSVLTTGNGYIGISLEHEQVLNFYGKDFKFLKSASVTKVITIKN